MQTFLWHPLTPKCTWPSQNKSKKTLRKYWENFFCNHALFYMQGVGIFTEITVQWKYVSDNQSVILLNPIRGCGLIVLDILNQAPVTADSEWNFWFIPTKSNSSPNFVHWLDVVAMVIEPANVGLRHTFVKKMCFLQVSPSGSSRWILARPLSVEAFPSLWTPRGGGTKIGRLHLELHSSCACKREGWWDSASESGVIFF